MTTTTNLTGIDHYFTAMANEALGRMDVAAARRLARQLDETSRVRRVVARLLPARAA